MQQLTRRSWMTACLASPLVLTGAARNTRADEPKSEAPASLVLGPCQATATPFRQGIAHTGGGNIHVAQPTPDTISVTMTGVAVAKGHMWKPSTAAFHFDLTQCLEVVFHSPQVKEAKVLVWGRTVGLLRSDVNHCGKARGGADILAGHATLVCGPAELLTLSMPGRSISCGQNLSIHDREGPLVVAVKPGKYSLHQKFGMTASQCAGFCTRPVSAEFAPDPALDADWISKNEPFNGAAKKDFGFQVILKIVAEEEADGKKK